MITFMILMLVAFFIFILVLDYQHHQESEKQFQADMMRLKELTLQVEALNNNK